MNLSSRGNNTSSVPPAAHVESTESKSDHTETNSDCGEDGGGPGDAASEPVSGSGTTPAAAGLTQTDFDEMRNNLREAAREASDLLENVEY